MVAEANPVSITKRLEPHEVLRCAVEELGPKPIAREMGVSPALVYKWCERPKTASDPESSGATSPLARVVTLYELTGHLGIVNFVCESANGFFCANPAPVAPEAVGRCLLSSTRTVVREFSEMFDSITEAGHDVTADEACEIRVKWEDLKRCAESFVVACERGAYRL